MPNASETFLGGYSAIFIDPGGSPGGRATPRWTIEEDGSLAIP
jgi:hypothetical protein